MPSMHPPPLRRVVIYFQAITLLWLASIWVAFSQDVSLQKDALIEFGKTSLWTFSEKSDLDAQWLNARHDGFSCYATEYSPDGNCGFDIALGDGEEYGIDLTHFYQIKIKFDYTGETSKIRVGYRNPSRIEGELLSVHYESLTTISAGRNTLAVPFDNFAVPDWWIHRQRDADFQWLNGRRNNVTHLGFNLLSPIKQGAHHFRNISVNLTGKPSVFNARVIFAIGTAIYALLASVGFWFLIQRWRMKSLRKNVAQQGESHSSSRRKFEVEDILDIKHNASTSYDVSTGLIRADAAQQSELLNSEYEFLNKPWLLIFEIYNLEASEHTDYPRGFFDNLFVRLCLIVKTNLHDNECAIRWGEHRLVVISGANKKSALTKCVQIIKTTLKNQLDHEIDLDHHLRAIVVPISQGKSIISEIHAAFDKS